MIHHVETTDVETTDMEATTSCVSNEDMDSLHNIQNESEKKL